MSQHLVVITHMMESDGQKFAGALVSAGFSVRAGTRDGKVTWNNRDPTLGWLTALMIEKPGTDGEAELDLARDIINGLKLPLFSVVILQAPFSGGRFITGNIHSGDARKLPPEKDAFDVIREGDNDG
jgi:hypothetical protein